MTMVIVFQQKKIKNYHQSTKKSCVIGEVKAKCFAAIVNEYKYQLTIA